MLEVGIRQLLLLLVVLVNGYAEALPELRVADHFDGADEESAVVRSWGSGKASGGGVGRRRRDASTLWRACNIEIGSDSGDLEVVANARLKLKSGRRD
jgi:hypothetical protein